MAKEYLVSFMYPVPHGFGMGDCIITHLSGPKRKQKLKEYISENMQPPKVPADSLTIVAISELPDTGKDLGREDQSKGGQS
jgi:hypothetical protein